MQIPKSTSTFKQQGYQERVARAQMSCECHSWICAFIWVSLMYFNGRCSYSVWYPYQNEWNSIRQHCILSHLFSTLEQKCATIFGHWECKQMDDDVEIWPFILHGVNVKMGFESCLLGPTLNRTFWSQCWKFAISNMTLKRKLTECFPYESNSCHFVFIIRVEIQEFVQ